jgi:3-oxoacyl-(acyl-carrier-protein) synthase
MERALQSAQISAGEVDYINAHGTATVFNDAAEGKAISQLFDGVPVSSTKSMMGHSLGAAGAVEAVISLLALRHRFLPANINFDALDDGLQLNVVANESRSAVVRVALSNSFGFGGTNASILMRTVGA